MDSNYVQLVTRNGNIYFTYWPLLKELDIAIVHGRDISFRDVVNTLCTINAARPPIETIKIFCEYDLGADDDFWAFCLSACAGEIDHTTLVRKAMDYATTGLYITWYVASIRKIKWFYR